MRINFSKKKWYSLVHVDKTIVEMEKHIAQCSVNFYPHTSGGLKYSNTWGKTWLKYSERTVKYCKPAPAIYNISIVLNYYVVKSLLFHCNPI